MLYLFMIAASFLVHVQGATGRQSESREGGSCSDSTLVALVPSHHDVAVHPPVSTPTAGIGHVTKDHAHTVTCMTATLDFEHAVGSV